MFGSTLACLKYDIVNVNLPYRVYSQGIAKSLLIDVHFGQSLKFDALTLLINVITIILIIGAKSIYNSTRIRVYLPLKMPAGPHFTNHCSESN